MWWEGVVKCCPIITTTWSTVSTSIDMVVCTNEQHIFSLSTSE